MNNLVNDIAILQFVLVVITIYIGGVTFSGSLVAFGKLSGRINVNKGDVLANIFVSLFYLSLIAVPVTLITLSIYIETYQLIFYTFLAIVILGGIGFVLPIGGGDMPVVISLLNSFSGIAAAFAGLLLVNNVLIVAGSLVGAAA